MIGVGTTVLQISCKGGDIFLPFLLLALRDSRRGEYPPTYTKESERDILDNPEAVGGGGRINQAFAQVQWPGGERGGGVDIFLPGKALFPPDLLAAFRK